MVNTDYQKLNNNNGEYRLSKTEQQQWWIHTIKNWTTTMVNTGYQKLNNNNGEYRLSKTEQQQW